MSYPLPQRGELEATGETCEPCGAPVVIVHTGRGPWKICVDPNCPGKAEQEKKPARGKGAVKKKGSRAKS